MLWLTGIVSAYRLGEFAGIVILGLIVAWLLLRGLGVLPRQKPLASRPASAWAPPPLLLETAEPAPDLGDIRIERRSGFSWPLLATALIIGSLATAYATGMLGGGDSGPWSHGTGLRLKTAFFERCQSDATLDCTCVFHHITASAPYDTPAGWLTLPQTMRTFLSTGDMSTFPTVFISAAMDCRRSSI